LALHIYILGLILFLVSLVAPAYSPYGAWNYTGWDAVNAALQLRPAAEKNTCETSAQSVMAGVYTANHMDVRAIIALTEAGSTTLWMSRIRSDIPIYAFTRHERTRRRVVLYRGVYPVSFDITHTDSQSVYREVFDLMLGRGLVEEGDLVIFTKGDMTGVQGGTNAMKILRVVLGD